MSRARRLFWRLLLVAGLSYAGVCATLLLAQNRLLYVGTNLPPHVAPLPYAHFNDANGTQLGWLVQPAGTPRGTVVFFHGNDEQAWQAAQDYAPYFAARGWRVVLPEYRGFDFRAGQAPTHNSVIADAVAATRLAGQRYPGPLFVAGNSLGAGIAAQAAKPGGAQRVLLFVPWDRMNAVAQERYPFVPARLLLALDGTDYDSCAALAGKGADTFIIYAGHDTVIPPRHAARLAACLGVPEGQRFFLSTATHMDWYKRLSPAQWNDMLRLPPGRD